MVWDEFTPGTMMKPHNERKTMVVNFTFLELESRSDNVWWTMAVARTSTITAVLGGWSRMLRDLLRLALGGPSGMQTAGMAVMVQGQCVPIFARSVCLLSDGDGLRQAMQWNGAGSHKPCFRHWNCLSKNHSLSQSSDKYVAIDCSSFNKLQLWSEDEWRTSIDVCVQARMQWSMGAMTKGDFDDTCQFLGFKATQEGLLACPELRKHMQFIDVLRYDWAHTFLADSLFGREMWAVIAAGKREGLFDEQSVYEFLSQPWTFPAGGKIAKGTKWNQLKPSSTNGAGGITNPVAPLRPP